MFLPVSRCDSPGLASSIVPKDWLDEVIRLDQDNYVKLVFKAPIERVNGTETGNRRQEANCQEFVFVRYRRGVYCTPVGYRNPHDYRDSSRARCLRRSRTILNRPVRQEEKSVVLVDVEQGCSCPFRADVRSGAFKTGLTKLIQARSEGYIHM